MKPATYRSLYIALSFALTLAACGPSSEPEVASATPKGPTQSEASADDTCGLAEQDHLISRPIDMPGMVEETAKRRFIYPDSQVTMDHVPERINFHIDKDGRITSMTCG